MRKENMPLNTYAHGRGGAKHNQEHRIAISIVMRSMQVVILICKVIVAFP